MRFPRIFLSLAALGTLAATSLPAAAATQALALVRSGEPVELICHGATCAAEFSSFCLQPELASPTPYTRYTMAPGPDVRLRGMRADGGIVELDANELRIKVLRTHVAVQLSLPHLRLLEHKLAKVTVEIGDKVALLPEPEAGETPLGAGEITAITTSLRDLGDQVVDSDGERMRAARLLVRLINALPPGGRESAEVRATIWDGNIRPRDLEDAPATSRDLVRQMHDFCAYGSANSMAPSMRSCLQSQHDTIMGGLNSDYWERVKNGT